MKNDNVIDMTERIQTPDFRERLKGLKVRLDLEQAKIAISTSLLSIVLLVTVANNSLMSSVTLIEESSMSPGRGIASVDLKSDDFSVHEFASTEETNESLVRELSQRDLGPNGAVGRRPSSVDMLAYGLLEGKYAVRLKAGKISEIEFSENFEMVNKRKSVNEVLSFLENHRELLPVGFDKHVRVKVETNGQEGMDTYQLINKVSMPVAKVQFRTDADGRVLAMQVSPITVANQ